MENPIFLCGWSYFIWIAMAYLLDFSECDIKGGHIASDSKTE